MLRRVLKITSIAIVATELTAVGLAASPAVAQSASQERRLIKRQQQRILQQQRQIRENQRQLQVQQNQLGRQQGASASNTAAVQQNIPRGLLGDIGGCPVGYTFSLLYGCLPHVIVN